MILPSLQEAGSPQWRPIKYSLFPPLGLATLAAYLDPDGRLLTDNWDSYDTRQVVFEPEGMSRDQLKTGYDQAYRDFYSWHNIYTASQQHQDWNQRLRHAAYSVGWKKMEPLWNRAIQSGLLTQMRRGLEVALDGRTKSPVNVEGDHALENSL